VKQSLIERSTFDLAIYWSRLLAGQFAAIVGVFLWFIEGVL